MKQLAGDVGLTEGTLYYILRFRRFAQIFPTCANLSWSHYRELLGVQDDNRRDQLLADAEQNQWTVGQLAEEIKALDAAGGRGGKGEKPEKRRSRESAGSRIFIP